jgi:hypothetical protein
MTGVKNRGHWISIDTDWGQLGDSDLYLHTCKEWWSRDGAHWERQPDSFEIYTSGTNDPLGSGRGSIDDEGNSPAIEEHLRRYEQADQAINALGNWADDPQIRAVAWTVDDAGIQRSCDPQAFILDAADLIEAIEAIGGLVAVEG